jgi:hypothetical protein
MKFHENPSSGSRIVPHGRTDMTWNNKLLTVFYFMYVLLTVCGPGSSVGIATGYGLDGPGIESRWGGGEIFRTRPDRPRGPPSLLYNEYRVFPGGKAAGA